jgi:quinol monooxygenase YgiN
VSLHPILEEIRGKLTDPNRPFGLLVSIQLHPEVAGEFTAVAERAAAETRREPGNRRYEFYQVADRPGELRLIEQWESFDSLRQHFDTQHLAEELAAIERLSAAPGSVAVLQPLT